jgi:hypothetical protein
MPDRCECPDFDLAVLWCEDPPRDIVSLPLVQFAKSVQPGTSLWGDGFPILTDASALGGKPQSFTLNCEVLGSDKNFMTLKSDERLRFSEFFLSENNPEVIDLAFAGASGTGLFDSNGKLAAIFLAREGANVTDKRAAFITTAVDRFRHALFNTPECKKINEEIERLARTIPELQGLSDMESLAALNRIEQALSERTLATSQMLACLVVARGWDSDEIQKIQSSLDDQAKVIDVHTTRFGGVECRIAGMEDRPVVWRELKADPIAEYRLADAPDVGIDGKPQGTDFIGAIGGDLNRRFDEPYGAPEDGQLDELLDEVRYYLRKRQKDNAHRFYYAARHSARQIDVKIEQVAEHFEGLIPFFCLQKPQDLDHDRAILDTLVNIMQWKPSP